MIDYRHLKYFLEVAEESSFSKAARNFNISQSAISRMIKSLETELGVVLFFRNAKVVKLTEAGVIFQMQARRCMRSFEHLQQDFDKEYRLNQDTLDFGLPPITNSRVFGKLFSAFQKEHPEVGIKLYEYGSKKVEEAVLDGTIDMGLVSSIPSNDFGSLFITHDDMYVVMAKSSPLARKSTVPLSAFEETPLVLYSEEFNARDEILRSCQKMGFMPKITFETSQRDLMIETVAAGLGCAIIPSRMAVYPDEADRVTMRRLVEPEMAHRIYLIWSKDRNMNRVTSMMIEYIRNNLDMLYAD